MKEICAGQGNNNLTQLCDVTHCMDMVKCVNIVEVTMVYVYSLIIFTMCTFLFF